MNAPHTINCDVLVVGAGAAGLTCALELAPLDVVVLSAAPLGDGAATGWAQGGIAAAFGADDAPALHAHDTREAAAGLADSAAVDALVYAACDAVTRLERRGAHFDRTADGALALGLEGAHSRRRIVRANGDATGAEVLRTLVAAARTAPHLRVLEGATAVALTQGEDGTVSGALVTEGDGTFTVSARATVLATGGAGALFARTTNPSTARGSGLALALRAGATLADIEFVQFHPTALAVAADPLPLVSEAVRGEGGVLVRADGTPVMRGAGGDLAPRDVVARAIFAQELHGEPVFLDARAIAGFATHFPTVTAGCRAYGIDPQTDLIPVTPAAHYHMGGVAVDVNGRTTAPGLWACGEVASSGVHGANRLASNSVLEALVAGRAVALDVTGSLPARTGAVRPQIVRVAAGEAEANRLASLRAAMTHDCGPVRDGQRLRALLATFDDWRARWADRSSSLDDGLLIGTAMAQAALAREESRGAHFRSDFPLPHERAHHTLLPARELAGV